MAANSKGAAETDRVRLGPGAMHGCRLSLGDPQEGTPDDADVWNRLGKCLVTLGHEDEPSGPTSSHLFRKAIALKPGPRRYLLQQGDGLAFPSRAEVAEAEKCMADMIAVKANAEIGRRTTSMACGSRNWESTTRP